MTLINQQISTNPHIAPTDPLPDTLGVVVIGRNEGERLRLSLESVVGQGYPVVYVDSGSTDGSAGAADTLLVSVVRLTEPPFSAARGRQVGLNYLCGQHPSLRYVQFVDGDCIVHPDWLQKAAAFLDEHPDCAIVAGRLRERHADGSLLIRLVNVDWDLPVGDIDAVGGIFMVRFDALKTVGGWRMDLVVGEDLDLSARVRAAGWKLCRLTAEMALHDMGIRTFGELWRRSVRSGFGYTEMAALHGWSRCRRWLRKAAGNITYGGILPVAFMLFLFVYWPISVGVVLVYALHLAKVVIPRLRAGDPLPFALLYGGVMTLLKIGAMLGTVRWVSDRLLGRDVQLMEYKATTPINK